MGWCAMQSIFRYFEIVSASLKGFIFYCVSVFSLSSSNFFSECLMNSFSNSDFRILDRLDWELLNFLKRFVYLFLTECSDLVLRVFEMRAHFLPSRLTSLKRVMSYSIDHLSLN